MRNSIKINGLLLLFMLSAGLIFTACNEEKMEYGETFIYMPQATTTGGVNTLYNVPSGGGEMTYNFKAQNGKINIILGVARSGTFAGEDFTVDIVTLKDETDQLVASGQVRNAVAMPEGIYSLPAKITVTNSSEATFYLSVDSATLINDLSYTGQNMVLAVGIANPTKYELSERNTVVMVILNIDAIRDHFFKYKEDFLYRKGTQLMLNGKTYQSVGINGFALSGCGSSAEAFSETEIDALFASLPNNVLVRTWAFPGNKAHTDKIIKAAERNNIKLILTLGDTHRSCGDSESKNQEWYTSGFRQEYLTHAKDMASTYKDSPAIGMWEMLNEPTFWDAPLEDIKAFYNEVAMELKNTDPNHLVATGTWANWAYGGKEGFQTLHNSNYIDVGTFHDSDQDVVEGWSFADCKSAMDVLGKVLIVSDIRVESADAGCMFDKVGRAGRMKEKFDLYLGKGAPVALASYIVKDAPSDCSPNFDINDPLMDMIKAYPANNP